MRFQSIISTVLAFSTTALAKSCNTVNPFADECVQYYGGGGCNNKLGDYTPTCEGNCFVYDFDSIWANGGEFETTHCYAYSDTNCQNQILDTGDQGTGYCQNAPGGKSMKCYYDC